MSLNLGPHLRHGLFTIRVRSVGERVCERMPPGPNVPLWHGVECILNLTHTPVKIVRLGDIYERSLGRGQALIVSDKENVFGDARQAAQ